MVEKGGGCEHVCLGRPVGVADPWTMFTAVAPHLGTHSSGEGPGELSQEPDGTVASPGSGSVLAHG